MRDLSGVDHSSTILQHLDDILVSIFNVLAYKISDGMDKATTIIDRTDHILIPRNDSRCQADTVIVFTEVRSLMDNASARFIRDVRISQDFKCTGILQLLNNKIRPMDEFECQNTSFS